MNAPSLTQNRFSYQARDQSGQVVQGFVNALTLNDASKVLRAEGKYIVDIKPAHAAAAGGIAAPAARGGRSVKREELVLFTIQLSVMVDTGVPLSDALTALSEQTVSPRLLRRDERSPFPMFRAARIFPPRWNSTRASFRSITSPLVRASEMSGSMGPILRRLADYLLS